MTGYRWLFFLGLWIVAPFLTASPLPDYSDPSRQYLSTANEKELGKIFMRQLKASGQVIEDPVDAQYINHLGLELVHHSANPKGTFFFFFLADPTINSFAGPGGYIAIDSGLILATQNEAELAAVIAHEIAHVTQDHLARKLADQSHMNLPLLAGTLAAIALGHVSGEAAETALAGTVAGDAQATLNQSRIYEEEADRIGIETLAKAAFNPYAMVDFFQRLNRIENYNLNPIPMLSNHPSTPERIADASNRAAQYSKQSKPNSPEYSLIKERLRVQTSSDLHSLINDYEKQPPSLAQSYGLALAEASNAEYAKALSRIQGLYQNQPQEILFGLAEAHVLTQMNQPAKALIILNTLRAQAPDNNAVMMQSALSYLRNNQAGAAVNLIKHFHLYYPQYPMPYLLLATCQAQAGQLAEAYQSRASYLSDQGEISAAQLQLEMALKLPHNDSDTQARLQAQLQLLQGTPP